MVRVLAEGRGVDRLVQHFRRLVLPALKLVADDRHLRLAVGVGDEGVSHAVGFELDGELQLVRGDGLEIVRAVIPGGRVKSRADLLEGRGDLRVLLLVEGRRALEHHVLQKMRRARVAHGLVARADLVEHHHGRHGRHPVLDQQHLHTIL
jgi:hypothetical protein